MIVSNKHQFIFVHNPKCAGQSTRKSLSVFHDSQIEYWNHCFVDEMDRVVDKAHLFARDICTFETLNLSDFFVFGFVRNPYDRFRSAFNQFKSANPEAEVSDINEFALSFINEVSIRFDWNLVHFCPQYLFFYNGKKCIADYIGKHENYSEALLFVSSVIGIDVEQYELNRSPDSSPVEQEFTRTTIETINSLYERDFLLFDYKMKYEPGAEVPQETSRQKIEQCRPSLGRTVLRLEKDKRLLEELSEERLARIGQLESELSSVYSSKSWRYSSFLRRFAASLTSKS